MVADNGKKPQEIMMFYNVENFFPPDSQISHNSGLYNWDDYKYQLKLKKILKVFANIALDCGNLPSVIGLAEIGDLSVLDDLTAEESPIKNYEIVYQQSNDPRNLSVALLFDKSKFSLVNKQFLTLQDKHPSDLQTRDVLYAQLKNEKSNIHFFVVHLPSKRNNDLKKNLRDYILKQLKEILQETIKSGEPMVIMGDFNENPDYKGIQDLLSDSPSNKMMSNPFEELFARRICSTYHGRKAVCYDQILYTEEIFAQTLHLSLIKAEVYKNKWMQTKDKNKNAYPLRTYAGSRFLGGFSDHFPVLLRFSQI